MEEHAAGALVPDVAGLARCLEVAPEAAVAWLTGLVDTRRLAVYQACDALGREAVEAAVVPGPTAGELVRLTNLSRAHLSGRGQRRNAFKSLPPSVTAYLASASLHAARAGSQGRHL